MTTITPLGRSVSVDDWKSFQGDVVLKMLYERTSEFGKPGYRVFHKSLINSSALAADELPSVLEYLCGLGLAGSGHDDAWLTERGFEFVRTQQQRDTCPTCSR
jgi:hypothetical protein